jgi:dTDP-glucose 4,6-dehydratase
VPDRPGHDRRYGIDGSKLRSLGWRHRTSFEDGLAATVDWFRRNESWWRQIKAGDWDAYYERQYGMRLAAGQAAAGIAQPGKS